MSRWRDNKRTTRSCGTCYQVYYGDLGHRDCPGAPEAQVTNAPTKATVPNTEKPTPEHIEYPF